MSKRLPSDCTLHNSPVSIRTCRNLCLSKPIISPLDSWTGFSDSGTRTLTFWFLKLQNKSEWSVIFNTIEMHVGADHSWSRKQEHRNQEVSDETRCHRSCLVWQLETDTKNVNFVASSTDIHSSLTVSLPSWDLSEIGKLLWNHYSIPKANPTETDWA